MPEHKKARTHTEPGPGGPHANEVGPEREDVESLTKQLEEERQKSEAYLANWQRTQADFVNYKRRTEQDRSEATKFSNAMLIINLLPAVDDLERAFDTVPTNLAGLTWFEGLRLIHRKLMTILENQGLQAIEAEGKDFDPNLHEAVVAAFTVLPGALLELTPDADLGAVDYHNKWAEIV